MYPPLAAVGAQPHHPVSRSPSICPTNILAFWTRGGVIPELAADPIAEAQVADAAPAPNRRYQHFCFTATNARSPSAPFLS